MKTSVHLATIAILVLVANSSLAQTSASYEEDSRYLYEMAQWAALTQLSEKALDNGFNTYAIRFMYSVALLETGRWNEAEVALKKTIDMNPFDRDARDLLRNLYLKTGRANEADRIQRIEFIRMVAVEFGQKISDVNDVGRMSFADISMRHRLATGSALTWSIGALKQSVYWGDISQNQGYLRFDQSLKDNWTATIGLTALKYNYSILADGTDDGDLALVGSMEFGKRFQGYGVSAQLSVSDLYESTRSQGGVRFDIYPGKWASWKLTVNPFIVYDEFDTKKGITASLHWYSLANTEIAVSGYLSDALNTIEEAGYIVNNSLDLTKYRTSIYLQRNIYEHLPIFVVVQYEGREERFFGFPYNSISWFAGLKYQL